MPQPIQPAVDQGAEVQKTGPAPFLLKTYQLVDDPHSDDLISWNKVGSAFIVWRPAEFARDLLPQYFKHNNFCSFVRQLNTYGFRKVNPDRWEFVNGFFKRGERELLNDIHRRKIIIAAAPASIAVPKGTQVAVPVIPIVSSESSGEEQALSSTSPGACPQALLPVVGCSSTADLVDENKRLKKENMKLYHELGQMKKLCKNIARLMSNYSLNGGRAAPPPVSADQNRTGGTGGDMDGTRLFGVSIGSKRSRGEEGEDSNPQREGDEVEEERLDSREEAGQDAAEERHWMLYHAKLNQSV